MQFGIFSVGDVTPDPTTGRVPDDTERVRAMLTIAEHADAAGLDVFATGEHHNPPFIASAPTTTLAYIGAQTERIILSTATKEKPAIFEVVSAGPGGIVDGNEVKMVVKAGDRVVTGKYSGTEVKLDGTEYTIVRQSDILAIVE